MIGTILAFAVLTGPHRTLTAASPLCPSGFTLVSFTGTVTTDTVVFCLNSRASVGGAVSRHSCWNMALNPDYFTLKPGYWEYNAPLGCFEDPSPLQQGAEACAAGTIPHPMGGCAASPVIAWEADCQCSQEIFPWDGGCPCPGFRFVGEVCP